MPPLSAVSEYGAGPGHFPHNGMPPLSFGHFPHEWGKTYPVATPIALTPGSSPGQALALSHRWRPLQNPCCRSSMVSSQGFVHPLRAKGTVVVAGIG